MNRLKLNEYRLIFVAVALAGTLLFSAPTLSLLVNFSGEPFSEVYVLDSSFSVEHLPSNIKIGENYTINLGINNNLDSSAYYIEYIKLRSQIEVLYNSSNGIPSPLPPLYEYRTFLQKGKNWTAPLTFSVSEITFNENQSNIEKIIINNVEFTINKETLWDSQNNGFYYQLLIELWKYDESLNDVYFDNEYVYLWLNMTRST